MKKICILAGAIVSLLVLGAFCFELYCSHMVAGIASDERQRFYVSAGSPDARSYIAHGGGVGEFTYSNSLEAVQDSLQKGFLFIELDLRESSDGHIVAVHDWKDFRRWTGYPCTEEPLSVEECRAAKIKGRYTVLTSSEICALMEEHKDFILVTDKIKDYELLLESIPYNDRLVVETMKLRDYLRAIRNGVRYPALKISDAGDWKQALRWNVPIVTVDAAKLYRDSEMAAMAQKFHDRRGTIFAYNAEFPHPAKEESFSARFLGKTVSKIYTDKSFR